MLKKLRRERGMSQGELAEKSGVNRSYLSLIETGKSSPTIDVAQRLAQGLGISVWKLISNVEERHFTYDSTDTFELYPGLKSLLDSEEDMLLINPTPEEIDLLKSIRFSGSFKPSKRFFIDALLDYRRSRK